MIKKIFTISTAFILLSCMNNAQQESQNKNEELQKITSRKATDVSYKPLNNYFVKNTVTELKENRFDSEEKFNEVFGAAPVMGEQGKPTTIDFSKESVIAFVLPETDIETKVEPISLTKDTQGNLNLNYKITKGNKQSFTTRPNFAVVINKNETGKVSLNEVK